MINSPQIPAFLIGKSSFKFQKLQQWTGGHSRMHTINLTYTITKKYYKYQCKLLLCVSVINTKVIRLIFLREFPLLISDSSILFRNS